MKQKKSRVQRGKKTSKRKTNPLHITFDLFHILWHDYKISLKRVFVYESLDYCKIGSFKIETANVETQLGNCFVIASK